MLDGPSTMNMLASSATVAFPVDALPYERFMPTLDFSVRLAEIRTRSCGHFFSNSFQFVITVIGSDAASVSTELMMNFWPFGIAAQR